MRYDLGRMRRPMRRSTEGQLASLISLGDGSTLSLDFTAMSGLDSRFTFSRASTATFINSSGLVESAANGVARFDHDPSTLAPRGLLLEGSATNLLEYSETFDSPWTLSNVQRSTTESTTAPDGTTVFAIETTSGTAARVMYRNAGVINATSVTFSYWFKPGNVVQPSNSSTDQSAGRRFAIYKLNPSTTALWEIRIDGQDPTSYTVVTGSGTYDTVAYPNGWYRCRLTTTITTGDSIRAYLGCVGNSTVDSLYWYVWGAQLEVGSGASSYIPTGAGTVQRAADVCYMDTPAVNPWFVTNNEATFQIRYECDNLLYAGTNVMYLAQWFGAEYSFGYQNYTYAGSGGTISSNFKTVASPSSDRNVYQNQSLPGVFNTALAFSQSAGIQARSLNGSATVQYATTTWPTWSSTIVRLGIGTNSLSSHGYVRVLSFKYWPTRLPNSTLQALTS